MQQRPPQTPKMSLLELLQNGLIENIELDGFKGKLIIRIEAVHIELHLSGSEPLDEESSPNGEER